jgi:ABC-type amino acid transport system permease subunit
MRHVVLPQAVRLVIPPLTNEYIGLFKASSVLAIVGSVAELTTYGRREAFVTFHVFEAFALVAGIYFLVTVPLSKLIERVERRYRIPGLGIQAPRTARE